MSYTWHCNDVMITNKNICICKHTFPRSSHCTLCLHAIELRHGLLTLLSRAPASEMLPSFSKRSLLTQNRYLPSQMASHVQKNEKKRHTSASILPKFEIIQLHLLSQPHSHHIQPYWASILSFRKYSPGDISDIMPWGAL